jgi:hypothetical protein
MTATIRYAYAINEHSHGDRAGYINTVTLTDYAQRNESTTMEPALAAAMLRDAGQHADAERIETRMAERDAAGA